MTPDLSAGRKSEISEVASQTSGAVAVECWKTIGVIGGDRTCPELAKHVHCRNCPVHAEAGARLLDRALPPGYREEWTLRLKERSHELAIGKKSIVVFRLGEEWLALPTEVFREVSERKTIRSLPHQRSSFVLGLVNIRGELLLCLSLERLCGLAANPADSTEMPPGTNSRLLVTHWNGFEQVFPVAEVAGVHRFNPLEVRDSAMLSDAATGVLTTGLLEWSGKTIRLLDQESLFSTINLNLL